MKRHLCLLALARIFLVGCGPADTADVFGHDATEGGGGATSSSAMASSSDAASSSSAEAAAASSSSSGGPACTGDASCLGCPAANAVALCGNPPPCLYTCPDGTTCVTTISGHFMCVPAGNPDACAGCLACEPGRVLACGKATCSVACPPGTACARNAIGDEDCVSAAKVLP